MPNRPRHSAMPRLRHTPPRLPHSPKQSSGCKRRISPSNPHPSLRDEVNSAIKPLREQAASWADAGLRERAADALHRAFDAIGWHDPGAKSDKKKKQREKRASQISNIRRGTGS